MAWGRLDDGYATHPKMIRAGLEATGLDARAIAHCSRYRSDGYVTAEEVVMLAAGAKNPAAVAARLVAVVRWHPVGPAEIPACRCLVGTGTDWTAKDPGYVLHDYLDYHDKAEVIAERQAADRKRKGNREDSARNPDGIRSESKRKEGRKPLGSAKGIQTESERNPDGIRADLAGARAGASRGRAPHPLNTNYPPPQDLVRPTPAEEDEEEGPSALTDQPTVEAVAWAVAQRRLARRRSTDEPVANSGRWLKRVAQSVADELRPLIEALLDEGASVVEAAEAVDPVQPSAPEVVKRGCCGTSPAVPHRTGCAEGARLVWAEGPDGTAVRVAG